MDYRDEPHFTAKRKVLSGQIQINTLFKNNYEIKRRVYNRNIYKFIRIPVNITVQPKNVCRLEFSDHL